MPTPATIAAIRFGYGLGPGVVAVPPVQMVAALEGPDLARARHPSTGSTEGFALARSLARTRKAARDGMNSAMAEQKSAQRAIRDAYGQGFLASFARILDTDQPLRERLVWFWADHFTAVPRNAALRAAAAGYVDEAIRPHVTGRFSDMLKAVVTHPFMLVYLDQIASVGPASPIGKRRGKGLNENLAREVLELHTLGVGGPYDQDDVRQLAELMTGLSSDRQAGFAFRPQIAEPGAERVLGKSYGGQRKAQLADVMAAMDDIAAHPATARHLARKLAVHFIADDPDPGLVDQLARTFQRTEGDLLAVYTALVEHPAATAPIRAKARQPFDFLAAALTALGFNGAEVAGLSGRDGRRFLYLPLAAMGQPFMSARGPDGWSEDADSWITPQGLASRISWSMAVAGKVQRRVGDPRDFLVTALGDSAGRDLRFAVSAAETRAVGVGLVLASAEFNRR